MRKIEYEGLELTVPDWANFVAGDSDGEINVYECEPFLTSVPDIDFWCCTNLNAKEERECSILPSRKGAYPCLQLYPERNAKPAPKKKTLAEVEKELASCYDVISQAERKGQELREIKSLMEAGQFAEILRRNAPDLYDERYPKDWVNPYAYLADE